MARLMYNRRSPKGVPIFVMPVHRRGCDQSRRTWFGVNDEVVVEKQFYPHRAVGFVSGAVRCPGCDRCCELPADAIAHGDVFYVENEV